jgi:DNA-binding transcriptional LysR family regulator
MLIDQINLNHLRIFECVYRTRSMTVAAQELHLTQSGVSQHIKAFEDSLGVRLFDRIKQRLVPTAQAARLFETCSSGLTGLERVVGEFKGGEAALTGNVTFGMPIEFGNNVLMPALAKFSQKHARVRFGLKLGFASAMNDRILSGDLDFAFVDDFKMDASITTEKVYDETLDLCASLDYLKKKGTPKNDRKWFESLDYVEYQKGEPILRMWFKQHLGTQNLALNVRADVMDVQGVARLITSGMGAGVLPGHLLSKLKAEGVRLHVFKGSGKTVKNGIRLAYLRERTHSKAVVAAMDWLKKAAAEGVGA